MVSLEDIGVEQAFSSVFLAAVHSPREFGAAAAMLPAPVSNAIPEADSI